MNTIDIYIQYGFFINSEPSINGEHSTLLIDKIFKFTLIRKI